MNKYINGVEKLNHLMLFECCLNVFEVALVTSHIFLVDDILRSQQGLKLVEHRKRHFQLRNLLRDQKNLRRMLGRLLLAVPSVTIFVSCPRVNNLFSEFHRGSTEFLEVMNERTKNKQNEGLDRTSEFGVANLGFS